MLIDKQKFIDWIDKHHAALFKHAMWMTGNRSLAEELVQETFYQAWKGRHGVENEDAPLPWLLTVLRRAVYKEHQHARLNSLSLSEEHFEISDNFTVEDLDILRDLSAGLESLSTRQREILLLHGLHGFSYEQIGAQLGIPVGTVMSRIGRARQMLRAFYATDEGHKVLVPFRKRK